MVKKFRVIRANDVQYLINTRKGEKKFGEKVAFMEGDSIQEFLTKSSCDFVLYGINEDVGVRANFGRSGAKSAFEEALTSLLNVQHNRLCKGGWLAVLGAFDFEKEMQEAQGLDASKPEDLKWLRELVVEIDKRITHLNALIVSAGKIPIIVGGGHNNAYGNLKGLSLGLNHTVNAINFDAHTDFRALEGRHSGNGFSYAFDERFLDKYFIFGLHENYTSKAIFSKLEELSDKVRYVSYEEMEVRGDKEFRVELKTAKEFIKTAPYGVEMDLDAIINVPSSAATSSGFSAQQARQFLHVMGSHTQAKYLHICEGAPHLDHSTPRLLGKLIAYMITDFIKAKKPYL